MKLTFLEADVPLTKTFTLEDGEIKKLGHPQLVNCTSHQVDVPNLPAFYTQVKLQASKGWCLLKGNVSRPLKSESRAGTTDATTPTRWMCLDLDGLKHISSVDDFMVSVGLGDVSYVAQYSASMGVLPGKGLSAHVFVLLNRDYLPDELKQWLKWKNFDVHGLRAGLSLTRTGNALRWTLDVSTCQNDKLIYIAPPLLGPGVKDSFEGERIQLVTKAKECATLGSPPNAEVNRVSEQRELDRLREAAGLEKKKWDRSKTVNGTTFMPKPDASTLTGVKHERGYVYLNLNGGDSWGYFHAEDNPEFIKNFKGEPIYKTSELLPEYWAGLQRAKRAELREDGKLYLAFRDFRTATYWNGTYEKDSKTLTIAQAKGAGQLVDFLKQHGQPVGDYIPDWTVEYDPHGKIPVDAGAKTVNLYRPSEFETRDRIKVESVPIPVRGVLNHVLGGDESAYEHLLNWLAVALQFKVQTGTAWVWHGIQGTGKGLMLNKVLRPMFGLSNVTSKRMQELDSQFNGFLERCQLLWLEEAEASAFKNAAVMDANFKNYIVEPFMSVRHMFQAPYEVKNYLNIIFSSNKDDPVVLDPHDRRFNIGAFQHEKIKISAADVEALEAAAFPFYCYLMGRKADRDLARTPLINAAKQQMVHINRTSIDTACDALLAGDLKFFHDQRPSGTLESLPRFEQDAAAAYAALVEKLPGMIALTRDEIFVLLNYVVGGLPAAPAKFSALLKHHRVHLHSVRRGEDVFRGVKVKWTERDSGGTS